MRRYRVVGLPEQGARLGSGDIGVISSPAQLDTWLSAREPRELLEPFTYVVDLARLLRLAPRRTEHVSCVGGQDVLAAGEIQFARRGRHWVVTDVSNQSTGYCPDLASWAAVELALDRAGVKHPNGFTEKIIFRRCRACGEPNVVRELNFVCALCGAKLPEHWNFDEPVPDELPTRELRIRKGKPSRPTD